MGDFIISLFPEKNFIARKLSIVQCKGEPVALPLCSAVVVRPTLEGLQRCLYIPVPGVMLGMQNFLPSRKYAITAWPRAVEPWKGG